MGRLFLTSDGIFKGLRERDRQEFFDLVGKNPAGIKVAFIPTAGYPYIKEEHVQTVVDGFHDYGAAVEIVDLKEENERTLSDRLPAFDVIYVGGGSAYWLLHWVRKSGFGAIIRGLLDEGKVYVGVSAGSVIAGPDVKEMTRAENVTGLEDTSGLGLVEFEILPHYSDARYQDLLEKSRIVDYPIIGLPDHQAVLVDGKICRVIGEGPRVSVNGFQETGRPRGSARTSSRRKLS